MDASPKIFDSLTLAYVVNDPYPYKMIEGGVFGALVTLAIEEDWEQTLVNLDEAFGKIAKHPKLVLATNRADIDHARESGKVAVVPSFQASSMVAGKSWRLRTLHRLGVRCMQVTYTAANLYGSGLGELTDGGLTFTGKLFVEEANALGILLDASHCGPKTALDIVLHSKSPMAFTHSNAYAVCPNIRNKPDEVIHELVSRGGVMGATPLPKAVRMDRQPTIEDYLDMIEYMVKVAGIDHVSIGSDFTEGYKATRTPLEEAARWRKFRPDIFGDPEHFFSAPYPLGLEGHADMKVLPAKLKERGFSDVDSEKILCGNFLSLFARVVG